MVALHFAVDWRNMGGSHHVFGVSGIAEKVCVPAHKPIKPPYPFEAYAHIIEPLPVDEGGGFLITLPDLPGCMADGATEIEAIEAGRMRCGMDDGIFSWLQACQTWNVCCLYRQTKNPAKLRKPYRSRGDKITLVTSVLSRLPQ